MSKDTAAAQERTTALVLRCCREDMSSKNGFVWPDVGGEAVAADWINNNECGNGLHGWLYGQGDHGTSDYWNDPKAKWLAVEVEESGIVMLGGKCKFERGFVRFVGSKSDAAAYIIANEPRAQNVAVIGLIAEVGEGGFLQGGALSVLTGGSRATLTGGDGATLTGGDGATLTGGYGATLTGGYGATLTGGYGATLTGGDGATLTGGFRATLTGGSRATLTGGDGATLTGGYGATLTGGDGATLTGGDGATLTGGDGATLTGGFRAELRIRYWDDKAERYRTAIAYVGEGGIKADTPYRLNDKHQFEEVQA